MSTYSSDRNLLVAVLGLQMEFIKESQLIAAMQAWIFRKSEKIENILLEQKAIQTETRDFLVAMAERHIALHDHDPARSLAALSSIGPVTKQLRGLEDEDVEQSIARTGTLRQAQAAESIADTISMPDTNNLAGERFRILRPHARGGLGQVSVAEDKELHREVALKEIQSAYASDPASRSRFMIEAEVTGRLEHPGVVPVYSLGKTAEGCPFYVMRFIKGDSLKEAIERLHAPNQPLRAEEKRMSLRRLLRRLIDVCNAIEYAHSRGVLHRDLKPGNIMLGKYGETLVVDWGLAKAGTRSEAHASADETTFVPLSGDTSSETRMGSIVGTLAYMSPEQAEGRLDALGPASDVYSLGATLYSVLTGASPVAKQPYEDMLRSVRTGNINRPHNVDPTVPAALEAICLKALATNPQQRYASAAALAEDLELWLGDEPVSAYREPLLDRTARFVRRHRALVTSVLAVLATAVVALLIVNGLVRRQNEQLKIAKDAADDRRNQAIENLAVARSLSLSMLTTAEQQLSSPTITGSLLFQLRKSMTEEAFKSFSELYAQNSDEPEVAYEFAQVARISGNLKRLELDLATANERTELSLQLQRQVPPERRTPKQKDYLSETYRELGTLRKAQGRLVEAAAALREGGQIAQELLANEPQNPAYRRSVGSIELESIGLSSERLELEQALEHARRSSRNFEQLTASEQAVATDPILLLLSLAREITLLNELKRYDQALVAAESAIDVGGEWRDRRPKDVNILLPLARIYYWSAEGIAMSAGDLELGLDRVQQAIAILEELVGKQANPHYLYGLGDAFRIHGQLLRLQERLSESQASLTKSQEWLEQLLKAADSADNRDVLAKTLYEIALLKLDMGETAAAIEVLQRAAELQDEACRLAPESSAMQRLSATIAAQLQSLGTP